MSAANEDDSLMHSQQENLIVLFQAVRMTSISWHNVGLIKRPFKPLNTIVLSCTEGFREYSIWPLWYRETLVRQTALRLIADVLSVWWSMTFSRGIWAKIACYLCRNTFAVWDIYVRQKKLYPNNWYNMFDLELTYYEWAKRTKSLLAFIYGSPWRYSNNSKIFKIKSKKIEIIFITILGLAQSFKMMNRLDPARPWRYLMAYFKESIKDTWNFDRTFIQVFNLFY